MKLPERVLTNALDVCLSKRQTDALKKRLFIAWEVFAVLTSVLSVFYLWRHRTVWPALPLLAIVAYVAYRVYRREPRRCPHCSKRDLSAEEKAEAGPLVYWFSRIFGGWFVRKDYWREELPIVVSAEIIGKPRWWDQIPTRMGPVVKAKCHYDWHCLRCSRDFEVKPAQIKSFEHRLGFLRNW